MTNKPTEPTNADIQAAHDSKNRNFSGQLIFSDELLAADKHRGILLRRLADAEQDEKDSKHDIETLYESVNHEMRRAEKLQAKLDAVGELAEKWHDFSFLADFYGKEASIFMDCGKALKTALKGEQDE